jgi:hypothetical protein
MSTNGRRTDMTNATAELWDDVLDHIDDARLVAWDGCHKIYLAMDGEEAAAFRQNYEHIVEDTPDAMFYAIRKWYAESCGLRFVTAVSSDIDGYKPLVWQFDVRDPDMQIDDEEDN